MIISFVSSALSIQHTCKFIQTTAFPITFIKPSSSSSYVIFVVIIIVIVFVIIRHLRHCHHFAYIIPVLIPLLSLSYADARARTMACTHTNVIYVHTQACTQATHVAHTRTYTHRHMHPHTKHAYTNTDPQMSDWLVFMYYHRNLLQASKKTTRQTARPARATTRPRRRKESSPKEKRCSKRSRKDKTTPKETVLLKDSMTRVCVQYRSARKLVSRLVFPH